MMFGGEARKNIKPMVDAPHNDRVPEWFKGQVCKTSDSGVRIPPRSLNMPKWWNGIHATLKMSSSQEGVGSNPTLGTSNCPSVQWVAIARG